MINYPKVMIRLIKIVICGYEFNIIMHNETDRKYLANS